MDLKDFIKKGVVLANLSANSKEDVFKALYGELYKRGKVKASFYKGLVNREAEFPTGLELNKYNVAIPHTDAEHVIDSCISVVTLKNPVTFQCMEDQNKSLAVRIVFMLAIGEAHSHIKMLQSLIMLIQNDEFLKKVLAAKDTDEIFKQVIEKL